MTLARIARSAGMALFVLAFVAGGVNHFLNAPFYDSLMPDYLPAHRPLVLISGAFEVALGVSLLIPPLSRVAAWGLIALLIAVFPANLWMWQHPERYPSISPTFLLLRLPLQPLLILWAYAYTRPARSSTTPATPTP